MNKKNNGFTLVEVLIAFSIFLIVATVIPQLFNAIKHSETKLLQRMETALFFQQLALEAHQSASISVVNNTLLLKKALNETVTYEYFHGRIRRQVNNKGQELVLQKVATIEFEQWKNGIEIVITDTFGQRYQHRLSHLLPLEEIGHG